MPKCRSRKRGPCQPRAYDDYIRILWQLRQVFRDWRFRHGPEGLGRVRHREAGGLIQSFFELLVTCYKSEELADNEVDTREEVAHGCTVWGMAAVDRVPPTRADGARSGCGEFLLLFFFPFPPPSFLSLRSCAGRVIILE